MSALREILAIFSTEVDDTGLKKGEKGVESFKQTLAEMGGILAGAFAVKEIVQFGREILQQADTLAKQSQALSVSTAELQGWQWAAQLSGSSAEEFTGAFTKFNRNVAAAAAGTGPAAAALKSLGVEIKNAAGETGKPIELLDGIADGIVGLEDPAKRTEAMMALFGKSGAKLLPLFLEGADGVKALRAEVEELGMSFDEQFLEDAQEVNDNIDRWELGLKGLAVQGLKPLLPYITELSKGAVVLVKGFLGVLKTSNALKVGLIVFGAVGAVKATGAMVQLAQKAGFLKNGLRGVLLQMLPLVAAFLALEDVWTFLTGGDSVTGDLIAKFFGKDAPEKVREFANALKETGLADFAALAKAAFGIFTSDEPLDKKFKDLLAYIDGPFLAAMKRDFGEVGAHIAVWTNLLTGTLAVLNKIIGAMGWIAEHTVGLVGKGMFEADDAAANADARARRRKDDGEGPSWYDGLRDLLVPSAKDVNARLDRAANQPGSYQANADTAYLRAPDPQQVLAQQQIASAPMFSALPPQAPEVRQSFTQNVTQNITAETPAELKRAARDGAKDGLTEGGEYLRTKRALVPAPGAAR